MNSSMNQVWKIIKQILRSNLLISQFPSTSEGLVSKLNKLLNSQWVHLIRKRINKMELSTNSCTQETGTFVFRIAFSDLSWQHTLMCCFQSCDKQSYILWEKHWMIHMTQASHIKALMWDSAVGRNLRLILVLVVSIHIFVNMSLWENVLVKSIFARIRGCK